ncbi:hypothetical protein PENARI_c063G11697 [Penicillium arizonense]|uniref:Uncharacterized protein n=1 Tax=Penicillium arizonense TaxID=1835702 RepID=A0A1F5L1M8_PENAI|nr:hypothetical protein PENARI_c063G11697 [Penicillium arizonense]OGE47114.1 hypothetical protein PENARI_c063G11697 [Penicillium arizonense]
MSEEQPPLITTSGSGVPADDSATTRLHAVRIWFPRNRVQITKDIKQKGLEDVVLDAIDLQELGVQHQGQDDHGIPKEASLVDLAVLETGISRVLGEYGTTKFVPLSSDDPIILQQPALDLDSKKALCYQHLHFKYQQEYTKRCNLAKVLGYEVHNILRDWYEERLEDICNRFRKLGYC